MKNKILGKQMQKALAFFQQVGLNNWHTYTKDTQTRLPIERLAKLGFLELSTISRQAKYLGVPKGKKFTLSS